MSNFIKDAEIEEYLLKYRLNNSENDFHRLSGSIEAGISDKIRQGDFRSLMSTNLMKGENHIGNFANNRIKFYEYLTVAGIALFSRNAIEAGANPDSAYDLSDVLLKEVETSKTVDEMSHLFTMSAVLFAKLVYKTNHTAKPYIIEQTKTYISRNIFKKIKLADIAEHIQVNPSYLSDIFSKTEGITLHEYIQKKKIELSCNFLMYSDISISVISEYTGFSTQSNFTAVFKKWKGMTPLVFRNRYFREK